MKKSKIPPCQNHSLSPTVEKVASATASAVAPRIQTAAFGCFRCGEFRSLGERVRISVQVVSCFSGRVGVPPPTALSLLGEEDTSTASEA